jgi:hypothetical protein
MSLRLTKPGMRSANLAGKIHPKTGEPLEPIGFLRNGTAVWPILGAASDDPDDPEFGDGGEDDDSADDDESDDDDDDDKGKGRKKPTKKTTKDEDDEEDDKPTRPERQAARYRTQLRAEQARTKALEERLQAIEDKDKKPDEIVQREANEAKERASKLADKVRSQNLRLAFYESNTIEWADPADALKLVDLDEVDVDDDGTVDAKALRLALKDLAKRKPHLVKPKAAPEDDEDDEDDDEEPRSKRTAPTMNRRKNRVKAPTRADLAKKFPVLNR